MNELRTIRLSGDLGVRFGRVHRLAVRSSAEAVRALCVTVKGFEQYLMHAKDNGMGFAVFHGKHNITEQELQLKTKAEIRISPVLFGSKNSGLFNIILGAALIVASFFVPGGGLLASALFNAGVSIALGGVVQLLAPPPKDKVSKDKADNEPNYAFNGPINTQAQGHCVPLLYGKLMTGSAVISAGISTDVPPPSEVSDAFFVAATSSPGFLQVSTDGQNWVAREIVPADPDDDFSTVQFKQIASKGNNFVASDGSDFYYSNDRVATWRRGTGSFVGVGRIVAGPDNQFLAWYNPSGDTISFARTDDGGQTWTFVSTLGGGFAANDMAFGSNLYVFVAGNASSGAYVSADFGASWTRSDTGNWTGVGHNGIEFLIGRTTFKHSSGGLVWLDSAGVTVGDVHAICGEAGKFFIGTYQGEIFTTNDSANTLVSKRGLDSTRFYSAACAFEKVIIGGGGGGSDVQYYSQDEGETFDQVVPSISDNEITVSIA